MKTFSIAELEQYSLIKAHTFRTWEQRFDIFKAQRKATNIRFYTLGDLAFLLDFALLNRFGYRVSKLAHLNKTAIREKVPGLTDNAAKQQHQVNSLIVSMFSLNIEDFEFILNSSVSSWGIDEAIEEIILPFLDRIQLFSYKGHTSPEYHFIVTALRKKLSVAIEQAKPKQAIEKSALLFLPQGEHYDLLLLYLNYKLRKQGLNVLYLGTNISVDHVKEVIQKKQPHFLVSYISGEKHKNIQKELLHYVGDNGEAFFVAGVGYDFIPVSLSEKIKCVPYREAPGEVLMLV